MSLFTDLLASSSAERRFLALLEPYDPATGAIRPVYLSSFGHTSEPTDTPASTYWEPRLKSAITFSRSMFSAARLSGRSVPGSGSLVLVNDDGGLDGLETLAWSGRRIRVWLGGQGFTQADYGLIFGGTCQGISSSDTEVTVALRDLVYVFDREIQPLAFGGTGGFEGTGDLKDRLMPICLGVCRGVPAPYLGPYTGRHLFRVDPGPIVGVLAVYDQGVPLTHASPPGPGEWTVDLATGVVALGGSFVGPVTMDVIGRRALSVTSTSSVTIGTGTKSFTIFAGQRLAVGMRVRIARTSSPVDTWMDGRITGYTGTSLTVLVDATGNAGTVSDWTISPWGTVAGLLRTIAASAGLTAIDDGMLSALDLWQPASVGYWIPQGGNAGQILDAIANGAGCHWGFDRGGQFEAGRLEVPGASVDAYSGDTVLSVERVATEEPNHAFTLRYRRNWQALSTDQLAGSVSDVTYFTNEWRQVTATNPATKAAYPLSQPAVIDSIFDAEADATAEASRQLALFGQRRDYFRVELKTQPLAREIGETVTLSHGRYGLSGGRALRLVDLTEDMASFTVTLGLYG